MIATKSLTEEQQLNSPEIVERLREDGANRFQSHDAYQTSVSKHHGTRADLLKSEMDSLRSTPVPELLNELRESGLLWSMIAAVVGVSDAAIRKWRRGEAIEDHNRRRLTLLKALQNVYAITGSPTIPFSDWIDTRIVPTFSATPLQLLTLHRDSDATYLQPLMDFMVEQQDGESPEVLLDRYVGPSWRAEHVAEQRFKIVTIASGERYLEIEP